MNRLEEIEQEIQNTQQLILLRLRGLHKLEERKAQYGLDVPLSLSNEIDLFETALAELEEKLAWLEQEKQSLEAPVIHLCTFGTLGQNLPENTHLLNWSQAFDRDVTPRKIPGPDVWEHRLWGELKALERDLKGSPIIRVEGTIALSAGFTLGHIFSQVGQYRLLVKQGPQVWRSDDAPEATEPVFLQQEIAGEPGGQDIGLVVNALPDQDSDDLIAAVQTCLGSRGGLKKLLLLEAEKAAGQGQFLESEEAAVLARTSRPRLRRFVSQNPADTLHIFLATPAGLAVLLGHQWNAIGLTGQLYEWTGLAGQYVPSCRVELN